jgi:hypothetical protein
MADSDYWYVHGCWVDFINHHIDSYAIGYYDWASRGLNDACNINKEYAKHWSAAILAEYGSTDDTNCFHGMYDYTQTAQKYSTVYHDDIYHTANDATSLNGYFQTHWLGADEVQTWCPSYDAVYGATPGSRAGEFMHEGWHAWQYKYGYSISHLPTQGNCSSSSCDWVYFHTVNAYEFGEMWQNNGTASRFHSPNQVQAEFLCDLADFHQWWVPYSVYSAASSDANQRSTTKFVNGPWYLCGSPRPL